VVSSRQEVDEVIGCAWGSFLAKMLLSELEPGDSCGSCIRMSICNNSSWLNPFLS
jgi:hypothetical protein